MALELAPQVVHALAEVHVNPPVVNQHVVHLQIRRLCRLVGVKGHKRVAERVARLVIADDVALRDFPEAAENDFKVLIRRHGIELAHKQLVIRWLRICLWQVTNHLQDNSSGFCLLARQLLLNLCWVARLVPRLPIIL